MSVTIHRGSILDCNVDAIVNPANGFLMHGAGLARVIAKAATSLKGDESPTYRSWVGVEWEREQKRTPTVATGAVAVTSAGHLPYEGIIHAVGPVWGGGQFCERALLASAHAESCAAALERGWASVAFPAISCGLFRFPVNQAAPIAVGAVWPFNDQLDVTFALMEDAHVAAYEDALRRVSAANPPA